MSDKRIGVIKKAEFGMGGYQDVCIGVTFLLGGDGWGVGDFIGNWATERSEGAEWTEEDRIKSLGEMVMKLNGILKDAKKESVSQLAGVPVEVTFDGMSLKDWRVLKEAVL